MAKIGIYLGTAADDVSNIQNVLKTWVHVLLEAGHNIDLVGGKNLPPLQEATTVCKVSECSSRTPFGEIKDSYDHVSQYISNREPDAVMQLWKYQTHAPGVALAGKLSNIATIVRFTGDVFQEYLGYHLPKSAGIFALSNIVGKLPLKIADKVVTLGPNLKETVRSHGVEETNIHLIPPPKPNEYQFSSAKDVSDIKSQLNIDTDRPTALFVGRLSEQKGMSFLQTVIQTIVKETDFQFVLVGDGPYRKKFMNLFSSENVLLPGYVPHDEIGKYYQAASVYVHPSRFEGIPLVVLEALQSRTPVVAREAGDIDFVLDDVVQTEQQMIDHLLERRWHKDWKNKSFFLPGFQRSAITGIMEELEL